MTALCILSAIPAYTSCWRNPPESAVRGCSGKRCLSHRLGSPRISSLSCLKLGLNVFAVFLMLPELHTNSGAVHPCAGQRLTTGPTGRKMEVATFHFSPGICSPLKAAKNASALCNLAAWYFLEALPECKEKQCINDLMKLLLTMSLLPN